MEAWGLAWPEIGAGDDLVALLAATDDLRDGDVVVVTSKVISKAEGRLVHADRSATVAAETARVVARRESTVIAKTTHGLVLAAAGVDASNTPPGTALLLPTDPDASARLLRRGVYAAVGRNVAIVVSDTAGRAWRVGQTDMAVGCAGLEPLHDLAGTLDTFGNVLQVTAAAVADELAAAADLVKAKTTGRPVAVLRGLAAAVLPAGDDGPGAVALVRDPAADLFALGVREAVVAAAQRTDDEALTHVPDAGADLAPFLRVADDWLASVPAVQRRGLRASLSQVECDVLPNGPAWVLRLDLPSDAGADLLIAAGRLLERADVLAAGHRLVGHQTMDPAEAGPAEAAWGARRAGSCWHPRGDR